jgi:hypothetical protein
MQLHSLPKLWKIFNIRCCSSPKAGAVRCLYLVCWSRWLRMWFKRTQSLPTHWNRVVLERNFPVFMEPDGSSWCSQDPATVSCAEPQE